MDYLLLAVWILTTLTIASVSVLLGKKYSVAYPIAMLASLIVIANVLASKIVMFGPLTVPAGTLVYAATFLITDLISELWGKQEARTAVWAGFYGSVLLAVSAAIAVAWQPAPFAAEYSATFAQVLGMTPRIVLASLIAYLLSQHHDIWAYHFWKRVTKGKHLWLRNNASTLVSNLIDTTVFVTIAFLGVLPLLPLIIGVYIAKTLIALVDTPFMYAIVFVAKRVHPALPTK